MGMLRRRARDERGSVVVEFGLIAPLLLLLVMGIIDFGWMLMKANVVGNATRDAARTASLSGSYSQIKDTLTTELTSAGVDTSRVTSSVTCTNTVGNNCTDSAASYDANATTGSTVTVTVTYNHNWITPLGAMCGLFGTGSCVGDTISVQRTSQMVRE
jgi:Flp pilus assembly protein TadG